IIRLLFGRSGSAVGSLTLTPRRPCAAMLLAMRRCNRVSHEPAPLQNAPRESRLDHKPCRQRGLLPIECLESRLFLATAPWGTYPHLIKQDAAISDYPNIKGAGEAVAVIDTGIDYRHPALGGGFGPGHKVIAGYDFADNDDDPMDTDGHGTGVA